MWLVIYMEKNSIEKCCVNVFIDVERTFVDDK